MNTTRYFSALLGLMALMVAGTTASAQALRIPAVTYTTTSVGFDGSAPRAETYSVGVKIAGPGSTQLDRPVTVTINLRLVSAPEGVDPAVALSYVQFNSNTLLVSRADTFYDFNITYSVPEGVAAGDYSYEITTTGWEAGYDHFSTYQNTNTFINVTLIPPPPPLGPPVVTISSPAAMANFTYTLGGPPAASAGLLHRRGSGRGAHHRLEWIDQRSVYQQPECERFGLCGGHWGRFGAFHDRGALHLKGHGV
jgi:hypothetical protein